MMSDSIGLIREVNSIFDRITSELETSKIILEGHRGNYPETKDINTVNSTIEDIDGWLLKVAIAREALGKRYHKEMLWAITQMNDYFLE